MFSPLLAYTEGTEWKLGIGDPTFMGWLTVFAYFLTAALCARLAFKFRKELSREWMLWGGMAAFLFALGVNKQLDLQTWLTLTFKQMAQTQGWYENRRVVQAAFIAGVALAGAFGLILLWWNFKQTLLRRWQLSVGVLFLAAFVLVRATSFHHVDQLLGMRFAGLKMNWILELAGIAFLAVAALRADAPTPPAVQRSLSSGVKSPVDVA